MIGSALVQRLAKTRVPMRLAARHAAKAREQFSNEAAQASIEIQECDFLAGAADYRKLVDGCDTVVHLAGLVHQPDQPAEMFEQLNVSCTNSLATAARHAGIKTFLFTSTMAVYGAPPFENISEDATPAPDTDYGRTKLRAENLLQQPPVAPRVIIVRPSLVYGPGDRGNMLPLIRQILKKRYFHIGEAAARKSVIYAHDLAALIELALAKVPEGTHVYNASNPQSPTVREIADTIARAAEMQGEIPTFPELLVRAGSYASLALGKKSPLPPSRLDKLTKPATCAVTKLVELTDFAPAYSLLDGLKAEIQWAKASGQLFGSKA